MKIQGKKKERGASILLLSFLFLIVLFLMASALYKLIPSEMHAANRTHQILNAHHVANSGVRQSVEWLTDSMKRFEAGEPDTVLPDYSPTFSANDLPNMQAFETFVDNMTSPFEDPRWRYDVELEVDPTTIGNSHAFQPRVFHIKSTAMFDGKPMRRVDAWIRQSTFASFAYYTDKFLGEMRIDGDLGFAGPVHTNDHFVFNVLNADQLDPTKPGFSPYFDDEVTFADTSYTDPGSTFGDNNEWVGGNKPYTATEVTPGAYERIFRGGRNDLRSKGEIVLPSTTDELGELAYGKKKTDFPTNRGVYVPDHNGDGYVDAGVFVEGSVNELFMGLDEVGNQRMVFENSVKNGTKQVQDGWITPPKYGPSQNYSPPKWNYKNECTGGWEWVDPPDNGGVAQGPTQKIKQCKGWTSTKTTQKTYKPLLEAGVKNYKDVDDWDKQHIVVVEAEEPTTLKQGGSVVKYPDTHPNAGDNVTAGAGETIVAKMIEDDDLGKWVVEEVQVLKGLPNGTVYINDGDIAGHRDGWDGLSGITKGTPDYDFTNKTISKEGGKTKYNSKVIATDLDHSIAFSGDLLQFDPDKFATANGTDLARLDDRMDVRYLQKVARDPSPSNGDPAELSTSSDHVLGVVTKDAWMKARRNNDWKNGNDKSNDVYAIILAGKTVDPDENVDGDEYVVGGFGTYWEQLNGNYGSGAMADFQVIGGVIQGTTGPNVDVTKDQWKTAHYWINNTGQRGYQVKMMYDRVATYQRLFPTYAEFEVIRYLERGPD
jgi:hypothetical protein